jgi:hypothetical protein
MGPLLLIISRALGCVSSDPAAIPAHLIPPLTGTVTVNGRPARIGDPLQLGDIVVARGDEAAAAIKFEDGTVLRLFGLGAPGGEAKLVVISYDVGTRAMAARFFGGLMTLVSPPKDPPPRKTIEALNTVTATEGTELKILSSPERDTISVRTGRVAVTTKGGAGEPVRMAAGREVTIRPASVAPSPAPYNGFATSEEKLYFGSSEDVQKHY